MSDMKQSLLRATAVYSVAITTALLVNKFPAQGAFIGWVGGSLTTLLVWGL